MFDDGFGNLYIAYQQNGKLYSIGQYSNIDLSVSDPEYFGTIDYKTGKLSINNFNPYSQNNDIIKFYANLNDADVFVNPNTILSIDTSDSSSLIINLVESAFRKPIK